jgi:hypothetical protein
MELGKRERETERDRTREGGRLLSLSSPLSIAL